MTSAPLCSPWRSVATIALAAPLLMVSSLTAPSATAASTGQPARNGRIVHVAGSGEVGDTTVDLFVANSDGTHNRQLTFTTPTRGQQVTGNSQPTWSPDGTRIAYVNRTRSANTIYTMSVDGGEPTKVKTLTDDVLTLAWSPDGTRIAYDAWQDADYEIFTIGVDGGEPTQVTDNRMNDFGPDWSPDSRQIAYAQEVVTESARSEIFVTSAAGGVSPTQLTSDGISKSAPDWSPDGSTMIYTADRRDARNPVRASEIYAMDSDGGHPRALTHNEIIDSDPHWSPDGTLILFTSEVSQENGYPRQMLLATMPAAGGERTPLSPQFLAGTLDWGTSPDVVDTPPSPGPSPSPEPSPDPQPTEEPDTVAPRIELDEPASFVRERRPALTWRATETDEVSRVELRSRSATVDGAFSSWSAPRTVDTTIIQPSIAAGRTACFGVRGIDAAGNVGSWSTTRCTTRPLDDRALRASSGWARRASDQLYGQTGLVSRRRGNSLAVRVSGARQVAVLATTCSGCGSVIVRLDGKTIGTVSFAARSRHDQQLLTLPSHGARSGVLEVVTRSGRPVLIDGLAVRR